MSLAKVTAGDAVLVAAAVWALVVAGARATPPMTIASTPADLSTLDIHPPQKPSAVPGHEFVARKFITMLRYIRPHLGDADAVSCRSPDRRRGRDRRRGACAAAAGCRRT